RSQPFESHGSNFHPQLYHNKRTTIAHKHLNITTSTNTFCADYQKFSMLYKISHLATRGGRPGVGLPRDCNKLRSFSRAIRPSCIPPDCRRVPDSISSVSDTGGSPPHEPKYSAGAQFLWRKYSFSGRRINAGHSGSVPGGGVSVPGRNPRVPG